MTEKEIKIQIKGGVHSAMRFVGPFEKRGLTEGLQLVENCNFDLGESLKAVKREIKSWKESEKYLYPSDHVPFIISGLTEVKSLIEFLLYPQD